MEALQSFIAAMEPESSFTINIEETAEEIGELNLF